MYAKIIFAAAAGAIFWGELAPKSDQQVANVLKQFTRTLVLSLVWAGIAFPVPAFAQAIGSVDRVIEKANRQPPGQPKVLANAGDALVQNELLETLAAASM